MNHWLTTGCLLLVGSTVAVASGGELAAGKKIYTGKCARCHKLYHPAKYDNKAWESWMQKMKSKAKLNDKQYWQLSEYVTTLRPPK